MDVWTTEYKDMRKWLFGLYSKGLHAMASVISSTKYFRLHRLPWIKEKIIRIFEKHISEPKVAQIKIKKMCLFSGLKVV